MNIEVVLYSPKFDQIIIINPCPKEKPNGCSTETENSLMIKIIENRMVGNGFIWMDDWIFLGTEVYEDL